MLTEKDCKFICGMSLAEQVGRQSNHITPPCNNNDNSNNQGGGPLSTSEEQFIYHALFN